MKKIREKNYAKEFGVIILSALILVTSLPMNLFASDTASYGDYVAGNGYVKAVSITNTDSNTIKSNATATFTNMSQLKLKEGTTYDGFATVNLSYRFEIPEKLTKNGTLSFANYSWLSNAKITKEDGKVILTGTADSKADAEGTAILPGTATRTIGVTNKDGVNDETFNIKSTVWLTADGDSTSATTTSSNVTITSSPTYMLQNIARNGGGAMISGYYNKNTGAFYSTKGKMEAAGDTGAVYGRFFLQQTNVRDEIEYNCELTSEGGERIDPTEPVAWTTSYKVNVTKGGVTTTETDPDYMPVLVDTKILNKSGTTGFVNNKDITPGGITTDPGDGLWSEMRNSSFTAGTWTGTDNGSSTSYKVDYSADSSTVVRSLSTISLYFVPLNLSDAESTRRVLVVDDTAMSLTGISGQTDTSKGGSQSFTVNRANLDTGAGLGKNVYSCDYTDRSGLSNVASISINGKMSLYAQETFSNAADANVNALNVLYKVDDDGITITKDSSFGLYDRGYVGGSVKALYACKADGSGWANEAEQLATRASQLRYYDSYDDIPEGYKIVGMLAEYRGGTVTGTVSDRINKVTASGEAGNEYITCTDVDIWEGDNELSSKDTYSGTNGGQLTSIAASSEHLYADDGGQYVKDDWTSGTGKVADQNGHKYADTILETGYGIYDATKVTYMNGTPTTNVSSQGNQYNISAGERTMAVKRPFTIKWNGTSADPDKEMSFHFVEDWWANWWTSHNIKIQDIYVAPADSEVTWDEDTGTFKGDGLTKVTEDNITVKGAGEYVLYYTYKLGDAIDISKDIDAGVYYCPTLLRINDSSKNMCAYTDGSTGYGNCRAATYATIIKDSNMGVAKSSLEPVANPNGPYGYSLSSTAQKADLQNYCLLDVLPFNNDGRGTVMNGTYKLGEDGVTVKMSAKDGTVDSAMDMYYTTDTSFRTKGESGALPTSATIKKDGTTPSDGATVCGVKWKKMEVVSNTDGTVTYKVQDADKDLAPVAVMMYGKFIQNEQYYYTIHIEPNDNERGDKYFNNATAIYSGTDLDIESNTTKVEIANKKINGIAFVDANNNGAKDDTEKGLSGVTVTLHKADGTVVDKDFYGKAYNVKTDANGNYLFNAVPDSNEGYYVTYDTGKGDRYVASDFEKAGVAADKNSDIHDYTNGTGTEVKNGTNIFQMYSYEKMVDDENATISKTYDAGFVPVYNVTFDTAGGAPVPVNQKIKSSGTATTVTEPTKEASHFEGWYYTDENGKEVLFDFDTVITKDYNLVAKWTEYEPAKLNVEGIKILNGGGKTSADIEKNQFSFKIERTDEEEGVVTGISEIAKTEKGTENAATINFDDWTFSEPGTYTFKISEVDIPEGYVGSEDVTATVKVTYNPITKTLNQVATYSTGSQIQFKNTYSKYEAIEADIKGKATLSGDGKTNNDIKNGTFQYTVTRIDDSEIVVGNVPSEIISTIEGGDIDFGSWQFVEPGVYEFKLSEKDNAYGYTKADDVIVKITVTLNKATNKLEAKVEYSKGDDSALFEHVYVAEKQENNNSGPTTGDNTPLGLWIAILAAGSVATGVVGKRKKSEKQ